MYSQTDLDLVNSFLMNPKAQAVFIVLGIWSLIWKGIALWKSSHHNQRNWFIALLIINSFGILEMIYIFYFQPKEPKKIPDRQ